MEKIIIVHIQNYNSGDECFEYYYFNRDSFKEAKDFLLKQSRAYFDECFGDCEWNYDPTFENLKGHNYLSFDDSSDEYATMYVENLKGVRLFNSLSLEE